MARAVGTGQTRSGNRGRTGLTGTGSNRGSGAGTIPPAPGSVQIRGRGTLSNPSAMKTGKHPAARGLSVRTGTLSNPSAMKSRGRQGR